LEKVLTQQYPVLKNEWHPTKNGTLKLNDFTRGSGKKAWWLCSKGHEWEAVIQSRTKGNGCPYCAGKKVLSGFNDLATTNCRLAIEWHPIKNLLRLNMVSANSNKKAWWLCSKGHEWEAVIQSRTKGNGCPYCGNRKTLIGINDLESLYPHIAKEWHPTKNNFLTASQVSANSNKKVWWQDAYRHEWEAIIANRTSNKSNCPYCTGHKSLSGFNDLNLTTPSLLTEWHPTKNLPLRPEDVTHGSHKKIWWTCLEGHEWEAALYSRTAQKGNNCPCCSNKISQAEEDILKTLQSYGFLIEQSDRRILAGKEIDLYLPEQKFGIEFNGLYWHTEGQGKDKLYHYNKWLSAKKAGVQLVQIWEDDWNRNRPLILEMLAHKLNVSTLPKLYARKTTVVPVTIQFARNFLKEHHIQGFASGSYYLGLKDNEGQKIKAVLVLKKETNNTLNIIRYATSTNVIGGFTKILSYSTKTYTPSRYITFSDNCVSDGALYRNNGFVADKELPPDYMYIVKGERKHKFGYRLKRFQNDSELLWDKDLTELELAKLNGLERIWDAGKTRWIKEN